MVSFLWLQVVTLFAVVFQIRADGYIKLHLLRYVNPDGRDIDGDRCDTTMGIKTSDCDPYFQLCVGPADGSGCDIASAESAVYRDSNTVTFGSSFGDQSNPMIIPFVVWPQGGVQIKIEAYDEDSRSDDDLLDNMVAIIRDAPSASLATALTREITISGKTSIFATISAYCEEDWYGGRCDRHCSPRDDPLLGHFTCSDIGEPICLPGWEGGTCTQDTDECQSDPCRNDGQCVDMTDGYVCRCPDGYTGLFCETELDECLSDPCLNGARCVDVIAGFTCTCRPGFAGRRCEIEICAGVHCLNGGSCDPSSGLARCACAPGFHGSHCEADIDECASDPCQGEGSLCTDLVNGFRCACADGRRGPTCSELLYPETASLLPEVTAPSASVTSALPDFCSGSPCGDHGTCTATDTGYVCHCADGTSGPSCTPAADSCGDDPCLNKGECQSTDDGFTCKCPTGFKGDRCELVVDPCEGDPCQHGGTCRSAKGAFKCTCPDHYAGDTCELEKLYPQLFLSGELDEAGAKRIKASVLQVLEDADLIDENHYRFEYGTSQCLDEDGAPVSVFVFRVFDDADNLIPWYRLEKALAGADQKEALPLPLYNGTQVLCDQTEPRIRQSMDQHLPSVWPLVVGVVAAALVIAIIASLVVAYKRRQESGVATFA